MSDYMGAFKDFVEDKDAGPGQKSQPRAVVASTSTSSELDYETARETQSSLEQSKPSSSGTKSKPAKKRRRLSSSDDSDDDDDSETDIAATGAASDGESSSEESLDESEPRAVAKRLRTQRSAKQKMLSKIMNNSRGRGGRGRGLLASDQLTLYNRSSLSEQY